jgi:DHA1 family bicyclomycin/chloramphenicol resistance-like MFS transporter
VGYVFGMALIQAAVFGYINSSQQLVAEHFGAGPRFPLMFAGMAMTMAAPVRQFAHRGTLWRAGSATARW